MPGARKPNTKPRSGAEHLQFKGIQIPPYRPVVIDGYGFKIRKTVLDWAPER
jgi:hypothetical protein